MTLHTNDARTMRDGQPTLFPLGCAWGNRSESPELAKCLRGARQRLSFRAGDTLTWGNIRLALIAELATEACRERGTPWPQPLVSDYARYFRNGNRTGYEGLVAARQQRLTRAVVLAALPAPALKRLSETAEFHGLPQQLGTPECWLDEVIDGAYLLCEQSTWSWAAHDDVYDRAGDVVPNRSRPYLDLGAGEVAAQLGWVDLVLGEHLDARAPGLRQRLREETQERIIRPFLERLDWHWLGLDGDVHNWNPWIHSNILVAALALVDDPELQARTVARCIEGLDRFLSAIPADGAIDEGFAYWWNGAGRALEGLALLEEASGGVLHADDIPVIRELIAFPHRMHLGGEWFLNVADGPARAVKGLPWDMLHRWATRLGIPDVGQHAAAFVEPAPNATAGLGRVLRHLLGKAGDAGAASETGTPHTAAHPFSDFTYLPSVQILITRQQQGTTQGLTLAAKGGHNGEHHNHRDVGSVVVAVDGVPLIVDAGQPTYTAQTFGPDRYAIRAMQSGWHSVPAPFGLEQGTGAGFAASVLQEPTPDEPALVLGLGAAYGLDHPEQWIRTSVLNRGDGTIVVHDRWTLPGPPQTATPDVDITYLLAGTVKHCDTATVTVHPEGLPGCNNGRGLQLRWKPATAVVLTDSWQLDDPLLSAVWGTHLTRLRFRMPTEFRASGAFTLTLETTP
jgi:hypothetical protein